MDYIQLKCVVVGDGAVGKTCLLISYTIGQYTADHIPTVFDNYNANLVVDGKHIVLNLWDTAGQEDYGRLRPLSYPGTQIFIICYSCDKKSTLENAENKWYTEISGYIEKNHAVVILVGTKCDLIESGSEGGADSSQFCTFQDGEQVANNIKADGHILCSAKTMKNLKELFELSIREALKKNDKSKGGSKKGKGCSVF